MCLSTGFVIIIQVYLSTRSGNWVLPYTAPNGRTYAELLYNRNTNYWRQLDLFDSTNKKMEAICSARTDHDAYKIKPPWRLVKGLYKSSEVKLVINNVSFSKRGCL